MGRKRKRDDFSSDSSSSSSSDDEELAPQPLTKKQNTNVDAPLPKVPQKKEEKKEKLKNYNTYYAIPISMIRSDKKKYLYAKEHIFKEGEDQDGAGRTLFVTNLAYDCTKEDLESIFSVFGPIQSIKLDSFVKQEAKKSTSNNKKKQVGEPDERQRLILEERLRMQEDVKKMLDADSKMSFSRAGYAHITFRDEDSIKKGFKKLGPKDFEGKVERGQKRGLQKYLAEHKVEAELDTDKLQTEVNQFMLEFDRAQIAHKRKVDELSNMPDADGWVTVTKKGKKKTEGAEGKKMGVANLTPFELEMLKQKAQEKQLSDFYRFQHAENRKNYIDTLRQRFEEDKKRVERMKQSRKFKPL